MLKSGIDDLAEIKTYAPWKVEKQPWISLSLTNWHPCGESLLPKSFQGLFVNINPTRGQCLDIQKGGTECFTRKGLMMKQYILPLEY